MNVNWKSYSPNVKMSADRYVQKYNDISLIQSKKQNKTKQKN